MYAGHALIESKNKLGFNSGASGYFLSRHIMTELIHAWNDPNDSRYNTCSNNRNNVSKWYQSNPGLLTASCLKEGMDVRPLDSRDEMGGH